MIFSAVKYHYLLDITKDKIERIGKEKGIAGIDRDAFQIVFRRKGLIRATVRP